MKKVFITGAGSGLGKEAAICLARRGHTVFASVHFENQIDELKEISQKENLNLSAFKLDILNEDERKLILNYDFDVFIANAAIGDSGSVADVDIERIYNVFDTNVFSNLHTIQLALSKMIKKKQGRIVIISSLVRSNSYSLSFTLLCFKICFGRFWNMLKSGNEIIKSSRENKY